MNLLTFLTYKICLFVFRIQIRNCNLVVQFQLLLSAVSIHRELSMIEKFFRKPFSSIHTQSANLLVAWKTTYSSITGKKTGSFLVYLKHYWVWLPSNLMDFTLFKKFFLINFLEVVKFRRRESRFWYLICFFK